MTIIWLGIATILCALLIIGYLVLVAYDARHATDTAPRTDMYTCDRHGLFPRKYALKLTGITEEPIEQCPMCLQLKFQEAKLKETKQRAN